MAYLDMDGLKRYHNNIANTFVTKDDVNDIKKNIGIYDKDLKTFFENTKLFYECNSIVDTLRVIESIFFRYQYKNEIIDNIFYIKSLEDNNIIYDINIICRLSLNAKNVEYSYGGDLWYNLNDIKNIILNKDEHVYFRFIPNDTKNILFDNSIIGGDRYSGDLIGYNDKKTRILTKPTKTFDIGGDIRTIIFGNNTENRTHDEGLYALFAETNVVNAENLLMPFEIIDDSGCELMFYKCTQLITTPNKLPATKLNDYCYYEMFKGCTSLIVAPDLPATELYYIDYADYCYTRMFSGCTSLTHPPKLPATKLSFYCYCGMFSGCTSLVVAPDLPATKVTRYCYANMFSGCTSLTHPPKLPATELSTYSQGYCYASMFKGCENLTIAPDLLYSGYYNDDFYIEMFYGCKNLKYIRCLLKNNIDSVLENWVKDVSPNGTFIKNPEATWASGDSGIPIGWVVKDDTEPDGGIPPYVDNITGNKHAFSVGENKRVIFSKGNLQYQATTNTWRFAEEQYTVVGKDNEKISSTYDGWIDLFGWGTSGYNEKHPYLWDAAHSSFGDGMNSISGTNYDWGKNAISNGENKPGIWRTLTADEWGYLLFDRPNAAKLVGAGTVNGQNGIFILPDYYTDEEVSFVSFADKDAQHDGDYWYYGIKEAFSHNTYSIEEFKLLESKGVVFLPSAAFRATDTFMTGMTSEIIEGYYWTGTPHDEEKAYIVYIFGNGLRSRTENFRSNGFSVRLVCDII